MTERNMVASGKALCVLRKLKTGEQQIISPIYTKLENAKRKYEDILKQYSDKTWCKQIGVVSIELSAISLIALESYKIDKEEE